MFVDDVEGYVAMLKSDQTQEPHFEDLVGVASRLEAPPPFFISDWKYSSSLAVSNGSLLSDSFGDIRPSLVDGVLAEGRLSSTAALASRLARPGGFGVVVRGVGDIVASGSRCDEN